MQIADTQSVELKDHCISENLSCLWSSSLLSLNLWSTQRSTIKSTICILFLQTDDKGVFSTSLSEEYQLAAVTFDLSPNDLWRLSQDSINYAFCEEHLKEKLKEKWKAAKPGMEKQFNFKFWTLLCCWIFCNVRWETTNKSVKRKKKTWYPTSILVIRNLRRQKNKKLTWWYMSMILESKTFSLLVLRMDIFWISFYCNVLNTGALLSDSKVLYYLFSRKNN